MPNTTEKNRADNLAHDRGIVSEMLFDVSKRLTWATQPETVRGLTEIGEVLTEMSIFLIDQAIEEDN